VTHSPNPDPKRLAAVLTPLQALGIVVGGTIGASIFLVPSVIAQKVPFLAGALSVWILGALISLAGVLTVSELAAMLPEDGGGYVYIRAAFGPQMGFLFAWADAVMIRAGAACTISFTFGIYFAQLIPAPAGLPAAVWQGGIAGALIATLMLLNVRGAKLGADLQVAGMALKAVALASALILPLVLWRGANHLAGAPAFPGIATGGLFAGLFAAMVPVMWTYAGWEQLAHLTEEVHNPGRNVPRVFAAGLLLIGALYLSVAIGIHYVLPWAAVVQSQAVGADLFRALFGQPGVQLISMLILLSTIFTANGAVMSGPRAAFALARSGDAPAFLSRVHPRFQTPANAVLAMGCWSLLMLAVSVAVMVIPLPSGLPVPVRNAWLALQARPLFDVMISWVMFGYLLLQALVAASLIVLRRSKPGLPRPFRVPGYPLVPVASMAATGVLMFSMAGSGALEVVAGLFLIALGLPVRWLYSRGRQRPEALIV
jgi:APA family basic amino acid/polyamine antiporter